MEKPYPSGKSELCRRFHQEQKLAQVLPRSDHRSFKRSGYVSSSAGITAQPETALEMIVSLYKFGPILIAAVIIVTLFGYKLDKMYPAIMQELTEREAHGQL